MGILCFSSTAFPVLSKPCVSSSTSFIRSRRVTVSPVHRRRPRCHTVEMRWGDTRRSGGIPPLERVLSILPYTLPLLDSLSFGRFVFAAVPALAGPILKVLGPLYMVYRGVPFVAFGIFLALYFFVVRNSNISRYIRFNTYQALLLDIALLIPQLFSSFRLGSGFPAHIGELASSTVFYAILLAVGYAVATVARGQLPDQIPAVSESVNNQLGY